MDSLCRGTLLAGRSVNYAHLRNGYWDQRFIEAGSWGFPELRELFQNVGFLSSEHLCKVDISKRKTLEVAAFLHKDDSNSEGLGNVADVSTSTLYAPALVISRGCNSAGIDECNSSIAGRMLGRGCICFVGVSCNATAQNTLTEVAFALQTSNARPGYAICFQQSYGAFSR